MDDESARDARVEKYGWWAQNLSDAEAESIIHDYGDIAALFKALIENAFGKNYSYRVVDTDFSGDSFFMRLYPEGNSYLNEMGVTFSNPTTIIAEASFEDLPPLDCDFDDLSEEIDDEVQDSEEWELVTEHGEWDGHTYVSCNVTISVYNDGSVFEGLPTVDDIDEYLGRIKKTIDSHKKK